MQVAGRCEQVFRLLLSLYTSPS